MRVLAGSHSPLVHRPAQAKVLDEEALFSPAPPTPPEEPRESFLARSEQALGNRPWTVALTLAGLAGTITCAAGLATGGNLGMALGLGAGLALSPFGVVTAGVVGLGLGAAFDGITGNRFDRGKFVGYFGGIGAGGLGSLAAGGLLIGNQALTRPLLLLTTGMALFSGGLTGLLLASNLQRGPATTAHKKALGQHQEEMKAYAQALADHQARQQKRLQLQPAKTGIEVEHGSDFVRVGDVDLEVV